MELKLKLEKWGNPVIFTKKRGTEEGRKKGYSIHVLWQDGQPVDYVVIKGFEFVRRDSSNICKWVQKIMIYLMLNGKSDEKTKTKLGLSNIEIRDPIHLVQLVKKNYLKGEYSNADIAIPTTIGQKIESYHPRPAFIRGVVYFNEHIAPTAGRPLIAPGDTVNMLYVKRVVGYPPTDVISFIDASDLPNVDVDLYTMFNKQVRAKTEPFLELMGHTWAHVLGQSTVGEFL